MADQLYEGKNPPASSGEEDSGFAYGIYQTGSLTKIDTGFRSFQAIETLHFGIRFYGVKHDLRYGDPIRYGNRGILEPVEAGSTVHLLVAFGFSISETVILE